MSTVPITTATSTHQVPPEKLTTLQLYVTAAEAHDLWRADPTQVNVLDVRTFEEYVLIGHAPMAVNIPLAFPTYTWDADRGNYSMIANTGFLARVTQRFTPDDTLLVMCRSGGRSAKAVNMIAQAGYSHTYNIIDGFEGDKIDDPESVHHGKRMRNGWKNSAPWTYHLDPNLIWLPNESELELLHSTLDI